MRAEELDQKVGATTEELETRLSTERGTSLIRNCHPVGPYGRRSYGGPRGRRQFLMSEVPL